MANMSGSRRRSDWLEWLRETMLNRPRNNRYLDFDRGIQIGKLCIDFERGNHSWRRSDPEVFWIDIQLFVKYKLSDEDVLFVMKMQAGIGNYKEHAPERNAYAEFMRGLGKLRKLNSGKEE